MATRVLFHLVEAVSRWLVPFLLIAAAALKTADLDLATEGSWRIVPPRVAFDVGLIGGEILLSIWLLSGWKHRSARTLGGVLFTGFFLVSLGKTWNGEASCGCFGAFLIPPAWMAGLDLALATGLLAAPFVDRLPWQAANLRELYQGKERAVLPALLAVAGLYGIILAGAGAWQQQLATAMGHASIRLGEALPDLQDQTAGGELNQGKWIVFFIRPGCPDCQQVLLDLHATLEDPDSPTSHFRTALVNISSATDPHAVHPLVDMLLPRSNIMAITGPPSFQAVSTPTICFLESGIVVLKRENPVDLHTFLDAVRTHREGAESSPSARDSMDVVQDRSRKTRPS